MSGINGKIEIFPVYSINFPQNQAKAWLCGKFLFQAKGGRGSVDNVGGGGEQYTDQKACRAEEQGKIRKQKN